jgi:DNA polymerase-3 subunit delta'
MTDTPQLAVPSWIATQTRQLLTQRGHAWLLQGPSGLGQYSLALALARAWLCEQPSAQGACGACGSCHAIDVRTHADLCVLMPETQMLELQWPLSEKAQGEIDDKKRKPSKEIRVDAMRDAVEFSQRTSARGRGKVVLVFPAEGMNAIAANALLKTLEEPPGDARFVLATESAHQLLPTIRSRCQCHTMAWPSAQDSLQWLEVQGLNKVDAQLLLQAAGGRPEDALAFANSPRDAKAWTSFASAMLRGDAGYVKEWSAPQLIDALHKLCHDLLATQVGATGRFFALGALPKSVSFIALSAWAHSLAKARLSMDHPYNLGLMQEALVGQAQSVLHSAH